MKNINKSGLPDKYYQSQDKSNELVGIDYESTKGTINILECVYEEATAVKSIGKVWLIHRKKGENYTIQNKSGDIIKNNVKDFIAGANYLYLLLNIGDREEWYFVNKDLTLGRGIGVFKLNDKDWATKDGNRCIAKTVEAIDGLDRNGVSCRLFLKDARTEDVIIFSNANKMKEEKVQVATKYDITVNTTNGLISMHDEFSRNRFINVFTNISENATCLVQLIGKTPREVTETVKVKRHYEEHTKLIFRQVPAEMAERVGDCLRMFCYKTDFELIKLIITEHTTIEKSLDDFESFIFEGFKEVVRDEKDVYNYSVKIVFTSNHIITVLKNPFGKIYCYSNELSDKGIKKGMGNIEEVKIQDITDMLAGSPIKIYPFNYSKGLDGQGKKIGQCWYSHYYKLSMLVNEISIEAVLMTEFNYGKITEKDNNREGLSEDEKVNRERHLKRYSSTYNLNNIVLNTKTYDLSYKTI